MMPHLPGIITGIQTSVTSVNLKQHKTLKLKNKTKTKSFSLVSKAGKKQDPVVMGYQLVVNK